MKLKIISKEGGAKETVFLAKGLRVRLGWIPVDNYSIFFKVCHIFRWSKTKALTIIPPVHLLITSCGRRAAVTFSTCKRPATWLVSVSKVSPGYRLGFSSKLLGEETSSRNNGAS